MSSFTESQILAEITASLDLYNSIVNTLEANYEALSKGRSQFPERFLTGESIKVFLTKLNKKNTADRTRIQNELKSIATDLKLLRSKEISETDYELKKRLSKQINALENRVLFYNAELNKVISLTLDDSPERVRYFYEDFLMFVANCKHEALELWKNSLSTFDELDQGEEYFAGRLLIDVSEQLLKDKGFPKPSADIRIAYLNSKLELKELKKIVSKAKAIRDSSKKLLDAFESDEVNFRRFSDKKNNLTGF